MTHTTPTGSGTMYDDPGWNASGVPTFSGCIQRAEVRERVVDVAGR
jgi:hypothetical protein